MGKINRDWHEANRMPQNATKKQRAEWHYAHAQNCGCRALTPSIVSLLKSQGLDVPTGARLE
jgi:hypothetical protein